MVLRQFFCIFNQKDAGAHKSPQKSMRGPFCTLPMQDSISQKQLQAEYWKISDLFPQDRDHFNFSIDLDILCDLDHFDQQS